MTDIFEGSHLETLHNENFVSTSERAWLRWAAVVEKLLGHDLDGNQDENGYSIDFAYEAFKRYQLPPSYVASIKANPAYTIR